MKNNFEQEIEKIEIPKELKLRRESGINQAYKEMRGNQKRKPYFKVFVSAVAIFVLLFGLMAASDSGLATSIRGFFQDITNWQGTVTGTEYKQATEEIDIQVGEIRKNQENQFLLPLTITLKKPEEPPYMETEEITLGAFNIINQSGKEIKAELIQYQTEPVSNGIFEVGLLLDKELLEPNNTYTLQISSVFSHKKADAPLEIKGEWQTEFFLNN